MSHDQSSVEILESIRKFVQALRRSSRKSEQECGVSGAQLFVLRKLADINEPLTLGELAACTLTHQSSVSVVVSRLVERGYVLRSTSKEDARRIELKLSAKGRSFLENKSPMTAQEKLAQALERMPSERRKVLAKLLSSLIEDAGLHGEESTMFFEEPLEKDL